MERNIPSLFSPSSFYLKIYVFGVHCLLPVGCPVFSVLPMPALVAQFPLVSPLCLVHYPLMSIESKD